MDVVQFAFSKEKGNEQSNWQVDMINQKTLVGKITALNAGTYVLDDGRNHYFTADKVVSISLY